MITKQQIPLVRILVFFIIGILIADYLRLFNLVIFLFPLLFLFLGIVYFVKRWKVSQLWIPGVLSITAIIGLGYIVYMFHSSEFKSHYIGAHEDHKVYVRLKISETPKTDKRIRCISTTDRLIFDDQTTKSVLGKIMLYVDTTELKDKIQIGDQLLVYTKIYPVKANNNPHVFDFRSYLYYRDVNLQCYISSKDIVSHSKSKDPSLFLLTQKWRGIFHNIILKYITDKDQHAIASAMLLGIKNNLDATLYDSFTNSGAVHVLAVSGLHVGFIAMIFYFLLHLIPIRSKNFKYIKTVLIIIIIFLYSLMTGMAPAIMRATIMYSIFLIANAWAPQTNKFNLLAFSAFVMLLYNPFMLFQAGFQFSYLAIWGIMAFYKPIRKLLFVNSSIGMYFVDMISVSFAAQLLVFPITIYYFHKFPTYFFVSGLIAIPAAAIIISLGIGLLLFDPILPIVNEYIISPLLSTTLEILIKGISWINHWPMASIDGIFINKAMMILIYLFIAFLGLYKTSKMKGFFIATLLSILSFQLVSIYHSTKTMDNNDFIIYDSYGNFCMDIFQKNKVYNIKSTNMLPKGYKFLTYNHRLHKNINIVQQIPIDSSYRDNTLMHEKNFLQVNEKLFYISKNNSLPTYESPLHIDYLILIDHCTISLSKHLESFQPEEIIIDHSVDKKQLWKWKKEMKSKNIKVHIIGIDGVFRDKL